MMAYVETTKRPIGRPRKLTDSDRIEKKRIHDMESNKSRVNIGREIHRWNMIKDKLGMASNSEVAKISLDSFEEVHPNRATHPGEIIDNDVKPPTQPLENLSDTLPVSSCEPVGHNGVTPKKARSGSSRKRGPYGGPRKQFHCVQMSENTWKKWNEFKTENNVITHDEVAATLLDTWKQIRRSPVSNTSVIQEADNVFSQTSERKEENPCVDDTLDIHGQSTCKFVITDQPCDEQLRVRLDTIVSVFGSSVNTVKADICSKTFVIDKSVQPKYLQQLDLRQVFSNQTKKEETGIAPKVTLLLQLDKFSLKTHDMNETKCPTFDQPDISLSPSDDIILVTNDSLLDKNNTTSSSLFKAPRLLQEKDLPLREAKKHESNYDEDENTNDEKESNVEAIKTTISKFNNKHDISTTLNENDVTENKHDRNTAMQHETENYSKTSCIPNENMSKKNSSYTLENNCEFEMTEVPQENDSEAVQSGRRYPKRARRIKLCGLENYYTNDEISDEVVSSDDEEDKIRNEKRKNFKRKRKKAESDSDTEYVPSDIDDILLSSDEEDELESLENSETDNESYSDKHEKSSNSDKQEKPRKVDAQIEKYKNILIEKGLESQIPEAIVNQRLLLEKLRLEVKQADRIEKYKTILIGKGLENKIPAETVNLRLLLVKLKLEVKRAERIIVDLNEHTNKFEMKTFTSFEQKNRRVQTSEKSSQLYSCKICNKFQSKTAEIIRCHIEKHINGELKCRWCGMEFSRVTYKRVHQQDIHHETRKPKKTKTPKVCEFCGHKAYNCTDLKTHLFIKHGIPSFGCRLCDEMLSTSDQLSTHLKQTHPADVLGCEKCGLTFQDPWGFYNHSKSCTFERMTADQKTCHHCGKTMASVVSLRSHIERVHDKEKYVQCELCPYSCMDRRSLNRHMDAHLGNKKYRCEICGVSMVQKYQLTTHMRTHNNEKPYKCDQCPYASAWNVQLKSHQKVHGLENTITCGDCGVVLKDNKALSRHQKKDHEEN